MTDAHETIPLAALWPGPRSRAEGRAHGALRRAGIQDLAILTRHSGGDLLKVRNFGPWALEEVRQRLDRLGLCLHGEERAT